MRLSIVRMLLCSLLLVVGLTLAVSAQSPPTAQAKTEQGAKALTPQQEQRLNEAQRILALAQAQAREAAERAEKVAAQIENLVAEFRFDLGITADTYQRELRVLDQKTGARGFFPKPPDDTAVMKPKKPNDPKGTN